MPRIPTTGGFGSYMRGRAYAARNFSWNRMRARIPATGGLGSMARGYAYRAGPSVAKARDSTAFNAGQAWGWAGQHRRGLLVGGGAGVIGLGVEAHHRSSGRSSMYNGY